MEKDIKDYIEKVKSSAMDSKDLRDAILRVKRNLDHIFDCCQLDISDGDLTKEQIVKDFLEEYEKENQKIDTFQSDVTYYLSQYEACKRILNLDKNQRNKLINDAKKKEASNPRETLYYKLNVEEEMMVALRVAIKKIREENRLRGIYNYNVINPEDVIEKINEMKKNTDKQIKDAMIPPLQDKISFLNEYGYIDDYIKENNEALEKAGLPGIQQVKRNPLPDICYDENRNIIPIEEYEDMGVIDFFSRENLEKLSPEELLVFELFWKSKYLNESLKISSALSSIDFLDLWPTIIDKDEKEIENIDESKLELALKRDIALTYFLNKKKSLTPELEEKYMTFLEKNKLISKDSSIEDIKKETEKIEKVYSIARDVLLGESVLVDKLLNKEIKAKYWGVVQEEIPGEGSGEDKVIAVEMPSFRGTLVFSINEQSVEEYLKNKNGRFRGRIERLPKYKRKFDENYSKAMASLYLPTSKYFKKYVDQKYKENPESPWLSDLAINFADSKKIKKEKIREER